jgi:hypothetical protein
LEYAGAIKFYDLARTTLELYAPRNAGAVSVNDYGVDRLLNGPDPP